MPHCSPDELMDVIEGVRPASSLPHLATCDACRAEIDELRALVSEMGGVSVPEPSPLFWDGWSARVREAVAAEAPPTPAFWRRRVPAWTWRPQWTAVTMAAAVVLAMVVLPQMRSLRPVGSAAAPTAPAALGPQPAAGTRAEATGSSVSSDSAPVAADEPLLAFIEAVAAGVDLEGAVSAGMTLESGAAEAAVTGLNTEEQGELRRLLEEALAEAGA